MRIALAFSRPGRHGHRERCDLPLTAAQLRALYSAINRCAFNFAEAIRKYEKLPRTKKNVALLKYWKGEAERNRRCLGLLMHAVHDVIDRGITYEQVGPWTEKDTKPRMRKAKEPHWLIRKPRWR